MTINFENEYGEIPELAPETLARQVISGALDHLDCPYEAQVSLLLVDDTEIHRLNLAHRGVDRPTDVLSFPMTEYRQPGDFTMFEEEIVGCFDPDSGELLLGDIVLSMDRVLAQAKEYGHSVRREYAFLIVHSVLHLVGYDHMERDEAEEMERIQEEILNELNILREESL